MKDARQEELRMISYSRHVRSLALATLLTVALWPRAAHAQQPPTPAAAPAAAKTPAEEAESKRAAKRELQAGDQAYGAKNYADALTHYQAAYADFSSPKILYPIGLAQLQLGQKVAALASLQQFVAAASPEGSSDVDDAKAKAAQLTSEVARVTFVTHPDQATITIDGKPIGTTPLAAPIVLDPGDHQVHIERPPYEPRDYTLSLKAGETRAEERTLVYKKFQLAASRPAAPPPPAPSAPMSPHARKVVLVAAAGTTAVLAAGAITFGTLALVEHGTYSDTHQTVSSRLAAASSGHTDALVADGLWGGAVLAGGFTAYWWWSHVRGQPTVEPSSPPDTTSREALPSSAPDTTSREALPSSAPSEEPESAPIGGATSLVLPAVVPDGVALTVVGTF